ncbi:MAG: ArsR family transcriptional regulator [Imperialibacter sp.]|uniref:ArsR family transcriptional regulator n=1 Tax=Imperialibacter sp. TaxID=2038411 RepID=UPI0032EF370C
MLKETVGRSHTPTIQKSEPSELSDHQTRPPLLDTLITSKTRIKLLVRFFLSPGSRSYLRSLETEFGESTNSIRLELNRLEGANLLKAELEGNKKVYCANEQHPLFGELNKLVRNYLGLDVLVEKVVNKLGSLHSVYLINELAEGRNASTIYMVIVGDNIDTNYLSVLVTKAEQLIKRKINYTLHSLLEMDYLKAELDRKPLLLLWSADE